MIPRLFLFSEETNTQILEDLDDTTDLKTVLQFPGSIKSSPRGISVSLGYALGSWLRAFHSWTSAPAQAVLRAKIRGNEAMRILKYQMTYGSFLSILKLYPKVIESHLETLQAVKDAIDA